MSAHTSGKWLRRGRAIFVERGEAEFPIIDCLLLAWEAAEPWGEEEALANACLIEAAPDLLDVCKRGLKWADRALPPTMCQWREDARAAIAKATPQAKEDQDEA